MESWCHYDEKILIYQWKEGGKVVDGCTWIRTGISGELLWTM